MFSKMAREIYNKRDVSIAPPRMTLQMFGGPYTIEKFRSDELNASILAPPFITSYMIVEERQQVSNASSYALNAKGTVRGLRRPTETVSMIHSDAPKEGESLYEKCCIRNDKGGTSQEELVPKCVEKKERGKKKKETTGGTLNAFMIT